MFSTAKGLLVPGEQVETSPARRLVGVVAELTALSELGVAAEACARLEPVQEQQSVLIHLFTCPICC